MEEKIIIVEDLRKHYGKVKAVDRVSFYVKKGEICAILGPNGAGKTTTLEIVEGLRKKDAGKITIFDKTVESIGKEEKERIGVTLQESSLFPKLTVIETINLFRSFYQKSLPAKEILGLLALEEKASAYVEKLSGGQKRRLSVALSLVNDPELVFLDEPTTGLDPQVRRRVWEMVRNLKKQGKSVILTTHYIEEAEELADYVFIMDHGKIIKDGTPNELIAGLGSLSYIEFESHSEGVRDILKENGLEIKDGERLIIKTPDFINSLEKLNRLSKEYHFEIKNLVIRQQNLEDVFLHLTGRTLRN